MSKNYLPFALQIASLNQSKAFYTTKQAQILFLVNSMTRKTPLKNAKNCLKDQLFIYLFFGGGWN